VVSPTVFRLAVKAAIRKGGSSAKLNARPLAARWGKLTKPGGICAMSCAKWNSPTALAVAYPAATPISNRKQVQLAPGPDARDDHGEQGNHSDQQRLRARGRIMFGVAEKARASQRYQLQSRHGHDEAGHFWGNRMRKRWTTRETSAPAIPAAKSIPNIREYPPVSPARITGDR